MGKCIVEEKKLSEKEQLQLLANQIYTDICKCKDKIALTKVLRNWAAYLEGTLYLVNMKEALDKGEDFPDGFTPKPL